MHDSCATLIRSLNFGFKKIFGEPDGKPLLNSLLNDVLELADPIVELQFQNLEQLPDVPAQRRMVYDLLCRDQRFAED